MLIGEEPEAKNTHKGFASAKDRHAAEIVIPCRKAMMLSYPDDTLLQRNRLANNNGNENDDRKLDFKHGWDICR